MRPALLLACLLAASPARADEQLCRLLENANGRHELADNLRLIYRAHEQSTPGPPHLTRALRAIERGDLLNAQRHLFFLSERSGSNYALIDQIGAAIGRTISRELRHCQEQWARLGP